MGRPGFKPGKGRQTFLGGFDSLSLPPPYPESIVALVRGCEFPEDRYYHAEYNVWLKRGETGTVVLGATSYGVALAVEFLAFLPKPDGTAVEAGRAVGLLELAKTVVSVRTPLAGTIVASNSAVVTRPGTLNEDPYGTGWLVNLRVPGGLERVSGLLRGAAIAPAFEEVMRLDNFDGARS